MGNIGEYAGSQDRGKGLVGLVRKGLIPSAGAPQVSGCDFFLNFRYKIWPWVGFWERAEPSLNFSMKLKMTHSVVFWIPHPPGHVRDLSAYYRILLQIKILGHMLRASPLKCAGLSAVWDIDEIEWRLIDSLSSTQQTVTDQAIDRWRFRMEAWVRAEVDISNIWCNVLLLLLHCIVGPYVLWCFV